MKAGEELRGRRGQNFDAGVGVIKYVFILI